MGNSNKLSEDFKAQENDSMVFAYASESVVAKMMQIIEEIGKQLRWQRGAIELLRVILVRIGAERDWVEFSSLDAGVDMWPDHPKNSAKRRVQKYREALQSNQIETGFLAIEIRRGRKRGDEYFPTAYKVSRWWSVLLSVQEGVLDIDALGNATAYERDAAFKRVISNVIREFGFQARDTSLLVRKRTPSVSKAASAVDDATDNPMRLPFDERFAWMLEHFQDSLNDLLDQAPSPDVATQVISKFERMCGMVKARFYGQVAEFNKPKTKGV